MSISVTNFGDYSVKSVKSFVGREGYGFNCNLYRGKTKVASCYDDASGGEVRVDWLPNKMPKTHDDRAGWDKWHAEKKAEQDLLKEHLATLDDVEADIGNDRSLRIDEGWFVADCVSKWEAEKDLRKMTKQCSTKTLFRLPTHQRGQYVILNAPFSERVKADLGNQHGEDIEIFNEVLARGETPSVLA